jgi:NAD(P)-dependent dehydrogenase (short-subunit alcohol dehydrogenase family)
MSGVSFENRVVVITGAGGGLGRAYALEIARRGGAVLANDLGGSVRGVGQSTGYADAVVAEVVAAGGRAVANYDDVSTAEGAGRIIQAALDHFGRVDAVILNAGNMRYGPFEQMSEADLDALLAVHVKGSFLVAQAAWPHMKAQGRGRLVLTTSSAGMLGNAALSAYGTAKGGVMGLLHALSEAGVPHGILCNALMPNAWSRMTMDIFETARDALGENPWGAKVAHMMDPAYTAGLAAYLASDVCATSHHIYSALGGRIGRAFVGITDGWQGPTDRPSSAEEIAAQIDIICDPEQGYTIPANVADEFRIVVEGQG